MTAQEPSQKFETRIDEVPFARIAETHEIDRRCPARGKEDNNVYHYAQNEAKNNFKSKGRPVPLKFADFEKLQLASEQAIASGNVVLQGRYPADRTRLHHLIKTHGKLIGEGSVVSLQAYVFNANYANTKYSKLSDGRPARGEAVDCDNPEPDWNDIHIALSPSWKAPVDECSTVVAEISPHYRPQVWDKFHDGQLAEIEALIPGLLKNRAIENKTGNTLELYVRLTGTLFYDASHRPCVFKDGKIVERHAPERFSIWEIHPIYRIEVYDRARKRWVDFDKWATRRG
ncbi:MAG TPA: hypothetical protein VLL54_18215 [Pyrinomonadaceae bacterium]|nr:hypothetical protein [Pyrinomonadaceae bacterium]